MKETKKNVSIFLCGILCLSLALGLGFGLSKDANTKQLSDENIVLTKNGLIRGIRFNHTDPRTWSNFTKFDPHNEYTSTIFLSVPYAAPPVSQNRFKGPKPVQYHETVYDADKLPPQCPQSCLKDCDVKESEDCLYLNIYVPQTTKNKRLPVSIWIHGGAFSHGASNNFLYDARHVVTDMNVIIVTINYRVGVLGFLALDKIEEGETSNANFGLQDQTAAIMWVKDNINSFGGDSNKITVHGQSAGASSTSFQLLDKNVAPLLQGVIIQSSPFSLPMKSFEEAQLQSHTLAQQLGCLSDVVELLVYCLRFPFVRHSIFNPEPRSKTTRELTSTATLARVSLPILDKNNPMSSFMYWSPVVDGVILVEQPTKRLLTRNGISKPVIMGTVSHEIELFLKLFLRRPMTKSRLYQAAVKFAIPDSRVSRKVLAEYPSTCQSSGSIQDCIDYFCSMIDCRWSRQNELFVRESCAKTESQADVKKTYADEVECDDRDTLQILFHDFIFACPIKYWARTTIPNSFFYNFKARQPLDLSYIPGLKPLDKCAEVACHTAEINYQFEVENVFNCSMLEESLIWHGNIKCLDDGQLLDKSQKEVEMHMHRYWANFMQNKDPNDNSNSNYPTHWPKSDKWIPFGQNEGRMNIGHGKSSTVDVLEYETNFKTPECDFWDNLHEQFNVYVDVGRLKTDNF